MFMNSRRTEPELSTYLHSRGARLGLPVGGTFELTARCNFACPMCYVHLNNARSEDELSAQQWLELARQAKDRGMIFVLLTGGEPFLRKDFFEIYEGMRAMGLMVSINSNGSLLNEEIRRKLIDNPPVRMNISLYGGSANTYRQMCGMDAFEQVVDNVCALKEAGIDVRLNYSITPYNRQDMARIYEISRELGVHIKAASYMYPPIRTERNGFACTGRLSAEEAAACTVQWDRLRLDAETLALRADAIKALEATEEKECAADINEGVGCRAGSSSFWITWDGRMLPCGMMANPAAYPLEQGFDAAWEQIRRDTRMIRMPQKCASCAKRQVCSVCAAVCVTETGKFDDVPEYVCRVTDETIRLMLEYSSERNAKV